MDLNFISEAEQKQSVVPSYTSYFCGVWSFRCPHACVVFLSHASAWDKENGSNTSRPVFVVLKLAGTYKHLQLTLHALGQCGIRWHPAWKKKYTN